MGHRVAAALLGSGELSDRLARLDGLPVRPASVRLWLGPIPGADHASPLQVLPDGLDSFDLDPGWLLRAGRDRRRPPDDLDERSWWNQECEGSIALNRLWRWSMRRALAAFQRGQSVGDPRAARLARNALLERLDLWALGALAPARLHRWFEAATPDRRLDLERRWMGWSGVEVSRRLAEAWGVDHARSAPSEPAPAVERWLDARVAAACAPGLTAGAFGRDSEPIARALVKTRLESQLLRRELARRAADEPPSPTTVPLVRPQLEALAEFAAGAAHELNNPLAVVVGRAQILLMKTTDPEQQRSLRTIVTQARRANQMLRDLMYIARPPEPRLRPCSFVAIVREAAADLLGEASSRGVHLSLRVTADRGLTAGDPDGLRHTADALIRNAIEAAPAESIVAIEIGASARALSLAVRTPGRTLTDEEAAHLFHPFYSGRQAGRGLGLGLPRVARWLDRLGGVIRHRRDARGGTEFRVAIPIKADRASA